MTQDVLHSLPVRLTTMHLRCFTYDKVSGCVMSKEKSLKKTEPQNRESKSAGQLLADKLFLTPKNCWESVDEQAEKEIEAFACSYMERK